MKRTFIIGILLAPVAFFCIQQIREALHVSAKQDTLIAYFESIAVKDFSVGITSTGSTGPWGERRSFSSPGSARKIKQPYATHAEVEKVLGPPERRGDPSSELSQLKADTWYWNAEDASTPLIGRGLKIWFEKEKDGVERISAVHIDCPTFSESIGRAGDQWFRSEWVKGTR